MTRAVLSLLLALMLALTSQSMAVARGSSAATGQMVICTSLGATLVYMDASGAPTSAPHICPDATINTTLAEAVSAPVLPLRLAKYSLQTPIAAPAPRRFRAANPPSRAPPLRA